MFGEQKKQHGRGGRVIDQVVEEAYLRSVGAQAAYMADGPDYPSPPKPRQGEIFEEIQIQNMLLIELGEALGAMETSISAVMNPIPERNEVNTKLDKPSRSTNVGRAIADNNQKLSTIVKGIQSLIDSVSI